MELMIGTAENMLDFSFVEKLPKREKSRFQKVTEHFAAVKAIVDEKGMIVPSRFAAKLLGVSQPRIDQLMDAGILERVEFDGHPFITETSIVAFSKSERKAGRPIKVLSDKELMKASIDFAKGK